VKVLIIDDSPEALRIAEAHLQREGLQVVCANSGRVGLDAVKRERPDLVLLDVEMPDMSGFEVCRALKREAELCMIPVIFLTASDSPADRVRGLDIGAVDYVAKPFDAVELRARVRAALRSKHLQDLLITYAHIDPLTGLGNRRALMERMQQEWSRIERHGGGLAFVMADIDHFKQINDTYGHNIGDRMLCAVAEVLLLECRGSDFPARYGGEEFAILVPEATAETAGQLAERCRQGIGEIALRAGDATITTTASFGVADLDGAESGEELVQAADRALYEAKARGRNRVKLADTPSRTPTGQ